MKYLVITKKLWSKKNFDRLNKNIKVSNKLDEYKILKINPKIIFFIHWSSYIPESLYQKFVCIQFHSSDLPRGRGGSPIQNQILLNIKKTKLTAFRVSKKVDSGPICLQENLLLKGNAENIFKRVEAQSLRMIKKLIKVKKIKFKKQMGKQTLFKRRKPSQSKINLLKLLTINKLYDFLRMLDAPSYPNAFIELKNFRFIFNDIKKMNNSINARVKIVKNEK